MTHTPGTRLGDYKFCSRRKHHVLRVLFSENWMTADGKNNWCKACHSEYRIARKLAFKTSVEVA